MMNLQRSGGLRVWAVGLVAVLMLGAVPAVPAAADHAPPPETHSPAGSGQLQGTELVEDQRGLPCFRAVRTLMGLRGTGNFEGRTATGDPVAYSAGLDTGQTLYGDGPLQVQLENTETYYHSPFGTHGTEAGGGSGCSPSTAGAPVPAEFRIFAAEGAQDTDGDSDVDVLTGAAWVYRLNGTGDKVPCVGVGSFARGAPESAGAWWAEWTLSADCVVAGNGAGSPGTGAAPRGTFLTHHGGHAPCFDWPCPNNLQIDYQQFLPKPGPYLRLTGPTTATVGCDQPVAVTARLTDTGWPAAGVPVSFSVAGPGPAVPASGTATTDNNGAAAFSFTAAVAGDYTVTATATLNGKLVSATHTARYANPPPLRLTLTSPPGRAQTEEQVAVTAAVAEACGPLAGAPVEFTVAWPAQDVPWTGQATPASGTVITGADGTATFSFSGNRAGDYQVTATTSRPGQTASDTRTLHLDIRDFKRSGALTFPASERLLEAAVVDPAGRYAYFGSRNGVVAKVDLATFERVGTVALVRPDGGEPTLRSAVIDPAGRFAYFGDNSGSVFEVDLGTFEPAGAGRVGLSYEQLETAVIDPSGRFAYFAGPVSPGRILKVDLATLTLAAALPLKVGDQSLGTASSAVMDPAGRYAYFGTTDAATGWVVKVDVATFQIVQTITLPSQETDPLAGVIDPAGDFAYFVMAGGEPTPLQPGATDTGSRVVKINLRTFERVGAITLPAGEYAKSSSTPAVMDPAGQFAYFGILQHYQASGLQLPAKVVKIDLGTFERAHAITLEPGSSGEDMLGSGVIDPAGGYAYFGTNTQHQVPPVPDRVVKVQLKRPSSPGMVAGNDSYSATGGSTLAVPAPGVLGNDADSDGDRLVAGRPSDPAGGSVTLNADGSLSYTPDAGFSGTDTFTYTASDGMGYSAPATVSVAVAPPPGPTGSAYGFYSSVSLFGGPAQPRGPSPTVTLPETGSATPVTATAPQGDAVYGPAYIFTSGQLDVSTEGMTESVTSSATVANVNRSLSEKFTADNVASTCTANQTGVRASTTITNGVLEVSEGDPDVDGDETRVTIPTEPLPNTSYEGQLESVGDRFRYVFNEQVRNPDGSITVYAAHQYLLGPTAIGDLYIGKSECGVPESAVPKLGAVADFDGDGATDVSVFRRSTGVWYLRQSTDGDRAVEFGADGDVPVPGDFDGDGTTDLGIYRPSTGVWYLRQSTAGDRASQFGADGDVAVPGDYDGDGTTDLAVYRPSTGVWYLRQSTAGDAATQFGASGDVAVPGDYDGDGTTDLGVYRPSTGVWYLRQSTDGDRASEFGVDGDVPVPGDYDGDGTLDLGAYRPATGSWYLRRSTTGDTASGFGVTGDLPVPGDYDGDGTTDLGVHRPESNVWYLRRSTTGDTATQFGAPGDIPLPLPAAIRQGALPQAPGG